MFFVFFLFFGGFFFFKPLVSLDLNEHSCLSINNFKPRHQNRIGMPFLTLAFQTGPGSLHFLP